MPGEATAATKNPKGKAKRAVIYARYSTEGQRDISVDDQITLCRKHVERSGNNITILDCYADRAKSGAGMLRRDELNKMLASAERREFDLLIVESLDRLSRDMAHLPRVFKDLRFVGVEILTVNEGEVNAFLIAMRGLMGEIFLKDVGDKINRHHAGRAREGKIPGALSYGYRLVSGKPGEREIDPDQAKVVRSIFEQYATGISPRTIAETLNADRIPSPTGDLWIHQTISNGRGFLANRMYLGEILWNRRKNIRNPETEMMVKRERDPSEWITTQAPHLRIVDAALWDEVQKVRIARARALGNIGHNKGKVVPRTNGLLAGLLRCAVCGADMRVSAGRSTTRTRRISCSAAAKSTQLCQHGRSYDLHTIEQHTITCVREVFCDPERVRQFLTAFEKEFAAEQKRAKGETAAVEKRRNEVEAGIRRYMHVLEEGDVSVDMILPRLRELEAERVALERRRQIAETKIEKLAIHPAAIKRWHTDLAYLAERGDDAPPELRMALRTLIDHIKVHPTKKKAPYQIEPVLRLTAIIAAGKTSFPAVRSPAEIGRRQGVVVNFDNGHPDTSEWPLSKNREAIVSLGIFEAA